MFLGYLALKSWSRSREFNVLKLIKIKLKMSIYKKMKAGRLWRPCPLLGPRAGIRSPNYLCID